MRVTDQRVWQGNRPVVARPSDQLPTDPVAVTVAWLRSPTITGYMLYSRPTRLEATIRHKPQVYTNAGGSLIFRPAADGWRLVGAQGRVLLQSHARAAHASRLELASAGGDLDVSEGR
jgi:hypothetical protein